MPMEEPIQQLGGALATVHEGFENDVACITRTELAKALKSGKILLDNCDPETPQISNNTSSNLSAAEVSLVDSSFLDSSCTDSSYIDSSYIDASSNTDISESDVYAELETRVKVENKLRISDSNFQGEEKDLAKDICSSSSVNEYQSQSGLDNSETQELADVVCGITNCTNEDNVQEEPNEINFQQNNAHQNTEETENHESTEVSEDTESSDAEYLETRDSFEKPEDSNTTSFKGENVGAETEQTRAELSNIPSLEASSPHLASEESDELGELIAPMPLKKSNRLSTISMASSIAALIPFIHTSKEDGESPASKPTWDSLDSKNSMSGQETNRARRRSWMKSNNTQRISLLMQQAASAAKQNRKPGYTTQAVADWTSLLDKSFDNCLGNVERFTLAVPPTLQTDIQSVEKSKQSTLKKWSRRSRMFFQGASSSAFGALSIPNVKSPSPLNNEYREGISNEENTKNKSGSQSEYDIVEIPDISDETYSTIAATESIDSNSKESRFQSMKSEVTTLLEVSENSIESSLGSKNRKSIFGKFKASNSDLTSQRELPKRSRFHKFLGSFRSKASNSELEI